MKYFLGIDVGGTKTHALIADEIGKGIGFGSDGPGSWEYVGYDGLTKALLTVTAQALEMAGLTINQIYSACLGLAGFDWPSQRQAHLQAIRPLKLKADPQIVNDAILGILAGAEEGWGVSVVSGTGCNCRGWSRDHKRQGRAVGSVKYWSGEAAGGWDIAARAMRAVSFEWTGRGPATALTQAFLQKTGAKNLDDLIEGIYLGRFTFDQSDALMVFDAAAQGDFQAIEVIRWAGDELGQMACGVINQIGIQTEAFEVVLIGSLFNGYPLLASSLGQTVHHVAPEARLINLTIPPVVGGVLLGMEVAGIDSHSLRTRLILSTKALLNGVPA